MKIKKVIKWLGFLILGLVIAIFGLDFYLKAHVDKPVTNAPHYQDGQFMNAQPLPVPGALNTLRILRRFVIEEKIDLEPQQPLPMEMITRAQLDALPDDALFLVRLGHSSMLLKVYGEYWLIDPVFSERASPLSFAGPKRFQSTPIDLAGLPPIDRVLISHNHYDHLDRAAIEHLAASTDQFLVPLGIEGDLQDWGVDKGKIRRFDWWQTLDLGHALLVFTPAQHFSGRGFSDRNNTLWGGWVIG